MRTSSSWVFALIIFLSLDYVQCYKRIRPYETEKHLAYVKKHPHISRPLSDTEINSRYPGSYPCLENEDGFDFYCYDLSVPLNHENSSDTRRLSINFQILPSMGTEEERLGALLFAHGGPGIVSNKVAVSTAGYLPNEILVAFDIIQLDTRGIGNSCGYWCPIASSYDSGSQDVTTQQAIDDAKAFAEACIAEWALYDLPCIIDSTKSPQNQRIEAMQYMSTLQAVADVEVFRELFNLGKLWLYGDSYGTEFVQAFAISFPDSVEKMTIDSCVDVTLDITNYTASFVWGLDTMTIPLLEACYYDDVCRHDVCGSMTVDECQNTFVLLDFKLKSQHTSVEFPLPGGNKDVREFADDSLEYMTQEMSYYPSDRGYILRAFAYAIKRDNFVPYLRWQYAIFAQNETSLAPIPGTIEDSWSTASYNVICAADYNVDVQSKGGNNATIWSQDFISLGSGMIPLPFGSFWLSDVPTWAFLQAGRYYPSPTRPTKPGYTPFPVLILTSDVDCSTPFTQSLDLHEYYTNSYLITVVGGPHVNWLNNYECVDTIVLNFLLGILPSQSNTSCTIYTGYIPLAPKKAEDVSVHEVIEAFDIELHNLPEYLYWGWADPLEIGCDEYGSATILISDDGTTGISFYFTSCELISGFTATGNGTEVFDSDSSQLVFDLVISGAYHGYVHYVRYYNGTTETTGSWEADEWSSLATILVSIASFVFLALLLAAVFVVVEKYKGRKISEWRKDWAFIWTRKEPEQLEMKPVSAPEAVQIFERLPGESLE